MPAPRGAGVRFRVGATSSVIPAKAGIQQVNDSLMDSRFRGNDGGGGGEGESQHSSLPALWRQSRALRTGGSGWYRVQFLTLTFLALDARDKPGHDEGETGRAPDVRDPRSKPGDRQARA